MAAPPSALNSAGLTADPEKYVPSITQIRDVVETVWGFVLRDNQTVRLASTNEAEFLPLFTNLADALYQIRPFLSNRALLKGWPHRVGRYLGAIAENFDAVARAWGWERLVNPDSERFDFLRRRNNRFRERIERPMYEAAISLQENCTGLECPAEVDERADEGRQLGFGRAPNTEDELARFRAAEKRWLDALWVGRTFPRIPQENYQALCRALDGLAKVFEKTLGISNLAPRREPAATRMVPDQPDGSFIASMVSRLGQFVSDYRTGLSFLAFGEGGSGPVCAVEKKLADRALNIMETLETLGLYKDKLPITIAVRRELTRLDALIETQLRRWGWSRLLDLDGDEWLKLQLAEHERNYGVPFRRANLAWRQMPGLNANKNADDCAEAARAQGLTPLEGLRAEEAEARVIELHRRWHETPALGETPPRGTADEVESLGKIYEELRRFHDTLPAADPAIQRIDHLLQYTDVGKQQCEERRPDSAADLRDLARTFHQRASEFPDLAHALIEHEGARDWTKQRGIGDAHPDVVFGSTSDAVYAEHPAYARVRQDLELARLALLREFDQETSGQHSSAEKRQRRAVRTIPWAGYGQEHVFFGFDGSGWPEFWKLAERAYAKAAFLGWLRVNEEPPNGLDVTSENFWAGHWIAFVHRLARERKSSALLPPPRLTNLGGQRLPLGVTVAVLPENVFIASARALEILAERCAGAEPSHETEATPIEDRISVGRNGTVMELDIDVRTQALYNDPPKVDEYGRDGLDWRYAEWPRFKLLVAQRFGVARPELEHWDWLLNHAASLLGIDRDAVLRMARRELLMALESTPAGAQNEPPPAQPSSPATNDAKKPQTLDDLTPTAWKLLKAIRGLGAVSSETAAGREKIAEKAGTGNHDSKHNKDGFRKLLGFALIAARKNTGTWITAAGIDVLDKRSTPG